MKCTCNLYTMIFYSDKLSITKCDVISLAIETPSQPSVQLQRFILFAFLLGLFLFLFLSFLALLFVSNT
jgi:uncharacterized protein involved in exopolysaccharide biosynthesis